MQNFECLYYFTFEGTDLIETKRLDLAHSAPLSDVFKWLLIENQTVRELTFESMNRIDKIDYREFKEGELKFDFDSAELTLSDRVLKLERKQTYHVSPELIARISNYLR